MSDRFQRGYAAAEAIATQFGVPLHELRRFASHHLEEDWPEGQGISTSDVSHHLVELALGQPELLYEEAKLIRDRDDLVAKVAKHTGRSEAETLERLRRLFAPRLPGICLAQAHYGMVGPRNHADPDGPSDWEGICGTSTPNESGMCDEHEQYFRDNFPGRQVPRLTEIPDWLVDQMARVDPPPPAI